MDNQEMENDVVDIGAIDVIGIDDAVAIKDAEGGAYSTNDEISGHGSIKTGDILAQVFGLISQMRDRDYWNLNDSEIQKLNKICPKILPSIIQEHSGVISCVLSVIGLFVKRIKMENSEVPDIPMDVEFNEHVREQVGEQVDTEQESTGLTGNRNV